MDYQPAIWLKLSSNKGDPHLIALGSIFSIHLGSSEMKALSMLAQAAIKHFK